MHRFSISRFSIFCVIVFYSCEDAVSKESSQYLGCYNDQSENRLINESKDWFNDLTPSSCVSHCSKGGYPFAGTQYGSECFCGYNKPPLIAKRADTECSKPCSGDSKVNCGGNYRLSVYQTEVSAIGSLPSGFHLGCFAENSAARSDAERLFPDFRQDLDNLTPKLCSEICFKRGYKFAGVQFAKECYCANKKLDPATKRDTSECKMSCAGDGTKTCGGEYRLNVYATGLTDTPANGRLIGCYEDAPSANGEYARILPDFKTDLQKTNSPRTCMNLCYQMGFRFSGVQYAFECCCASKQPPQAKIKPDDNCATKCSGDPSENCGGNWRIQVYRTPLTDGVDIRYPTPETRPTSRPTTGPPQIVSTASPNNCRSSSTTVNGKRACKSTVVFYEDFQKLDKSRWSHDIKVASKPDFEFTVYDSKPENVFIKNGALHIRPTLFDEQFVENGNIKLDKCTGEAFNDECSRNTDFYILPPTQSARINTRQKFTFKYGIVEIRAKLPVGDWIVPEIWLVPAENAYGSYYESGKIRILSRGNSDLKYSDGSDMGSETLEGGVLIGYGTSVKSKSVYYSQPSGWRDQFHNFTIIWTPDDITFMVNGRTRQNIMVNAHGSRLNDVVGYPSSEIKQWNGGTSIAPFDQPFYVSLGLSVGGVRDFEDGCVSGGKTKPWSNTDPRAMLKFWNQRNEWQPTWQGDTALVVDSIKITAL